MDQGEEGNTGNAVGSVQEDAVHPHQHTMGTGGTDT